jgi:hypothetical protein
VFVSVDYEEFRRRVQDLESTIGAAAATAFRIRSVQDLNSC